MLKGARHENLQQVAAALRRRADGHGNAVPPHLRQELRHLTRMADQVHVLLRTSALRQELLDLAETVLRGLDQQLRDFEEAAADHAVRQTRFLEQFEQDRRPKRRTTRDSGSESL